MVLAGHGRRTTEGELRVAAQFQPGGIALGDLGLLASQFGLEAEIGTFDADALTELVTGATYPIVFLNRAHLDDSRLPRKLAQRRCLVHAVVPVRLAGSYIWINDPRSGELRKVQRKKFEAARHDLSDWCVVCRRVGWSRPAPEPPAPSRATPAPKPAARRPANR
jgi:ABC-type bacteriocin/lantibiotic exporter with double-glycine peptidase domain